MFYAIGEKWTDWRGYKLVLPAVSIGNVGQLAVDLLVTMLNMKKVGYLYHSSLQSLCGNDAFSASAFSEGKLTIGIEVFESAEKKLVCIQQRVLFVKGRQAAFRQELREWVKACQFSSVILLTSSSAHERIDCQLTGSPFRYLATPAFSKQEGKSFEKFGWLQLEKREDAWSGIHGNQTDIPEEARGVFIPGGGLASRLFSECCKEDIPLTILLVFCSEGDNIPDALNLVHHLNQWLMLAENKGSRQDQSRIWKFPGSWSLLFGREVDPTMY
ncbi:Proteasome assembly chaperone 2 [Holothuria leucospilota]|uniref:Proteasome assembly chaperone 2 n=1 Tax=Holothuria leucospilota TaxID=206669 RepID=A0A9Q1CAV8_HOLLE|nr:Proteasome assembly chaperone 2 [Holothuria leucospilota]